MSKERQIILRCAFANVSIFGVIWFSLVYVIWSFFDDFMMSLILGIFSFFGSALLVERIIQKPVDSLIYKLHNK